MALVKVLRTGQVTLPAPLRRRLKLDEGALLEAEEVEGGILLRPVAVVDRTKAWQELMAIVDRPKWRGPGPEPGEDELMEIAVEAVNEVRRKHAKSRS